MKTCPNCNEVVGDSADQCFNCKYSFKYGRIFLKDDKITAQDIVNILNSNGSENFSFCYKLDKLIDNNNTEEAVNCIQGRFNCEQETANNAFIEYKKQIYDEIKKFKKENQPSQQQIAHANAVAREWQNKPKCPTCSSTNVQKIGTGERAVSVAVLGIFSKKINKSFKCKNCGYTW